MLTQAQLQNAVQSNPVFARSLGWDRRLDEIAAFLGVAGASARDPLLAQRVELFQAGHTPLARDGVIGPKTWPVLKAALDETTAAPFGPGGPPPRNSAPTPERVKALDDWLLSITEGHPGAKEPWTFYEAVDAYLGPFGEKGYPLGYGRKYCVLFNSDRKLAASATGKAWVRRTTILLQTYLRAYIVDRYRKGTLGSLTEAELRQAAFASHPRAYTQGGLTLVALVSPGLLPTIISIPAKEFVGDNALASWAQALETGMLVVPEAVGTALAGLAGPAHTGLFARAAEKDRQEFLRRIQVNNYLSNLKTAIEAGRLDRVAWLERVTRDLNAAEFPDRAATRFAAEVVQAADARKRQLAAKYRQDIHLAPDLRAQYDNFDPGWDRW